MKRLALVALLSLSLLACTNKAEEAKKAAAEKARVEESVKKAQDDKAAAEAALKLAQEEQARAEAAAKKAQEEQAAAAKRTLTDGLSETLKTFGDTKGKLVEHSGLWKTDGNDAKVQAVLAFIEEYGKVEGELSGVKAYLLQDDLAKAATAFQTAKASFDSLEAQAATLLEDRPREMEPTVRAIILELIAKETCLQKDRNLGRLTDLELASKRNELLGAANYTLTQYELLRAKINFKPQPTDATVIGAHMNEFCPDEATLAAEAQAEAAAPAPDAAPTAPAVAPAAPAPAPEVAPAAATPQAPAAEAPTPADPSAVPADPAAPGRDQVYSGPIKSAEWSAGLVKLRRMGNKVFGTVKFGRSQISIAGKWADLMELRGSTDTEGLSCQVKDQDGILNGSCSGKLAGKSGRATFNIKSSSR